MKKTIIIAAAMAVLAAGAAAAQQAPAARGLRADTDGDRRISQSEFVDRRVERLTAADANRDGSVTSEERRAVAQTRKAGRAAERFQRLDANGDGAITRDEFEAPRAARADRAPARAMRMARRANRMERTGGAVVIAEAQARAEQAFVRLDADRDGYVTVAERRVRGEAGREQRRERMANRRARMTSAPAPTSE
ncbi:MAG TPA: EF-hand domain-containing protein [Brevundimonas sp.]|nr:EF-hand domain-containing protein [Brevundimonas sp.]